MLGWSGGKGCRGITLSVEGMKAEKLEGECGTSMFFGGRVTMGKF